MKSLLIVAFLLSAGCASVDTKYSHNTILQPQFRERQLLTINPFLAHKSYFWVETADGLEIVNK